MSRIKKFVRRGGGKTLYLEKLYVSLCHRLTATAKSTMIILNSFRNAHISRTLIEYQILYIEDYIVYLNIRKVIRHYHDVIKCWDILRYFLLRGGGGGQWVFFCET